MARRPDRALRLAVADLAVQPPADIEAVLAALPDAQACRVTELLAELKPGASSVGYTHLSGWLAQRIEQGSPMTDHASRVLRDCAKSTIVDTQVAPKLSPSLVGRVGSMLVGLLA